VDAVFGCVENALKQASAELHAGIDELFCAAELVTRDVEAASTMALVAEPELELDDEILEPWLRDDTDSTELDLEAIDALVLRLELELDALILEAELDFAPGVVAEDDCSELVLTGVAIARKDAVEVLIAAELVGKPKHEQTEVSWDG